MLLHITTKISSSAFSSLLYSHKLYHHYPATLLRTARRRMSTNPTTTTMMMRAIQFDNPGDEFHLANVPRPTPQKGEVVVKQRYTSINPMDHKVRLLNYFKSKLPNTPGYDLCGTVIEVGEGARFAVGDEVFGQPTSEGLCFAEYVVASDKFIVKRTTIPALEGGGSTIVFGTAWFALFGGLGEDLSTFDIHAKKHQGKTIYVPGGGGGVGHMIVQLARANGFKVIASASKPESIKVCKDSGAEHVIDYSKSDVISDVMKFTNNEGVDVVVDTTNTPNSYLQSSAVVKKGGTWICVANKWEDKHQEALQKCKEREVAARHGDYGRYWYIPEFVKLAPSHIQFMLTTCDKLYKEGVSVKVGKTIPLQLEEVKEEVKAVAEGKRYGKVIVEIAGSK